MTTNKTITIMELNKTRTTKATDGYRYTFKVDEKQYYLPENGNKSALPISDDFRKKGLKFVVCRTNIVRDKGGRFENVFGRPRWVEYDNGLIGFQNYDFFKDRKEAENLALIYSEIKPEQFKYTIAYTDIFVVELD